MHGRRLLSETGGGSGKLTYSPCRATAVIGASLPDTITEGLCSESAGTATVPGDNWEETRQLPPCHSGIISPPYRVKDGQLTFNAKTLPTLPPKSVTRKPGIN